jgi:hypothetical protein
MKGRKMADKYIRMDGTEDKCCMRCKHFASWYDIFYQEDPEEPMDFGECYYWYDKYDGDGEGLCDKFAVEGEESCEK